MTNNADAQIAREWASKALDNDLLDEVPLVGYRAAARHILATTTPPTMDDIAWDDAVHAGLCALYANGDLVRMIGPDIDNEDTIICHYIHYGSPVTVGLLAEKLTPLPGTRLDLTPRREPEPESTPDHPTELTIEADYRNAPTGTVVATEGAEAWTKDLDGLWETWGIISGYTNYAMVDEARRVLRWGWEA